MLSALLLFLYSGYEERRAGQEAELLLDDIQSAIAEETDPTIGTTGIEIEITESTEPTETLPAEMPVVMIDGYEYIGYVSIPDLELELPVMAEWDYNRLKIAPCRHFGSHSSLEIGAEVIFTNMDGIENRYTLMKEPETLAPDAVDAVQNSGYDLVLIPCTQAV